MFVPVIGIAMAVRMRVARAVGVRMLVLVEHDLDVAAEHFGDAA
jgi:hypothetical protein